MRASSVIGPSTMFIILLQACSPSPREAAPVISPDLAERSRFPPRDAETCRTCHPTQYQAWSDSQHAHANRLWSKTDPRPPNLTGQVEAVIGVSPLQQYLVTSSNGRLQALNIARDSRNGDWFNMQGDSTRGDQEWGHWRNRGMNWNSQCAFCHMTGFKKNYDATTDTYRSTWTAMGVSCLQCHPGRNVAGTNGCLAFPSDSLTLSIENCASCHARREELTGSFSPGQRFDDHFRLMLPDQAGLFHPDGQVADEDFEYSSFLLSRLAHKGVTCLDCHEPHSGKTRLPVENNALCLQCHNPPGIRGAKPITPEHSHHPNGSTGTQCVNCHMPENMFMVRDARRDHGFTRPDPVLTIELGIPNACNGCHRDKDTSWAANWTDTWYGTNMNARARERARGIHLATQQTAHAAIRLIELVQTEEIDAWRATLIALTAPWATRPDIQSLLLASTTHTSALVRSASVRTLAGSTTDTRPLAELTRDPVRLVRLDAIQATYHGATPGPEAMKEFQAYLDTLSDQPAGALRQAEKALLDGRHDDAISWARRATQWDASGQTYTVLARVMLAASRFDEAETAMKSAARIEPDDAQHPFSLGLLYGQLQRIPDALTQLERATHLDPDWGRAWYNLGLVRNQLNDPSGAIKALETAEQLMPDSPEPPYALASIHLKQGDTQAARAALERVLPLSTDKAAIHALLDSLPKN